MTGQKIGAAMPLLTGMTAKEAVNVFMKRGKIMRFIQVELLLVNMEQSVKFAVRNMA